MTMTPSDWIGRHLQEFRKERGWTAAELAERCASAGAPEITAPVIANIETGRRNAQGKRRRDVTVDELLTLGWVLGVPPLLLVLPLGTTDAVQITPGTQVHPGLALRWFSGEVPAPSQDRRIADHVDLRLHRRAALPILLHARLDAASEALTRAESTDDEAARDTARRAYAAALDAITDAGLRPPPIWRPRYDALRALLERPDEVPILDEEVDDDAR